MNLCKVVIVPIVLAGALVGCGGSANPAASPGGSGDNDTSGSSGADAPDKASASSDDTKPAAAKGSAASIAVGLQTLEKRSASLEFDLNLSKNGAGSGVQHGEWSFSEERTLRVKKAKSGVIQELEVVYGKWEAKPLLGMTYEVPTDGKTYLVSFVDKLSIMRGTEKASSAEEKAVTLEYGWVGNPSSLRQAMLDTKMAPDIHLTASPQISAALLGAIPGVDIAHAGIMATVKSVKSQPRQTATLEVAGSFSIKSKKTTFDIELKGPAEVDLATGWVQSMDLQGTASITGQTDVPKKGAMDVEGKGKVTITRHSEFR
jgi:hypothetical protein